ncbi:MAG TPA: DUF6491 family protein [Rhodanobacteraceae bacterium]|nr:DUF6491 family protein [Rhodanobacteraceae bacterium]
MKHLRMLLLLAPVMLLGACAANHARAQRDQAHLAAVHAAAGKPVGSFNYMMSTLYSWEPLSENELLIYTRPDKAWLLNVGLCQELPYTTAIGLTSHVGQVSSGLDSVIVHGGNFPCHIQEIRPVDVKLLKQKMEQRSGGKVVPEPGKQTEGQ